MNNGTTKRSRRYSKPDKYPECGKCHHSVSLCDRYRGLCKQCRGQKRSTIEKIEHDLEMEDE